MKNTFFLGSQKCKEKNKNTKKNMKNSNHEKPRQEISHKRSEKQSTF